MAKILVVEDEDMLRRNIALVLNGSGHDALPAKDGLEARKYFAKKSFDILITDLYMPASSGIDLIDYVSDNFKHTDIIIITAFPNVDTAIYAVKKRVADYFTKPFKTSDFLCAIERLSENKREVPFDWGKLSPFGLTKREMLVVRVIVHDGITENSTLSEHFGISIATVKQHLANIYGKFGVNTKSSLITSVIKTLRQTNTYPGITNKARY